MKPLSEQQRKVLKRINDQAPKQFFERLTKEAWANPVTRELVDRGLKQNDLTPELREKLEFIKRSPEYSARETVVNEEYEKKLDEYFTRKVRQAIKKGELPPLTKEQLSYDSIKKSIN